MLSNHPTLHLQDPPHCPTVLITGAGARIGAAIAHLFHYNGYNIVAHGRSVTSTLQLFASLNSLRPNSCKQVSANFENENEIFQLAKDSVAAFGHIDIVIHNASEFYATPFNSFSTKDWQRLMASNAFAPLLLSQQILALTPVGQIISVLDAQVQAQQPHSNHVIYNMAKAAHSMMVYSLAIDLSPNVRVNGVAPGCNVWPHPNPYSQQQMEDIIKSIPVQRIGNPNDIAQAVYFLAQNNYITGQIISVDGGRSHYLP